MQRDDDYLRSILQEWEASDDWTHFSGTTNSSDDAEERQHHHVLLLADAGLVARFRPGTDYFRITHMGHDFLAHTRKSESWEAVKTASSKVSGAGIGLMVKIAEALVMQKLKDLNIL